MAGGRQADEMQVNFEIFKIGCRLKYSTCRFFNQGTASLQPYQSIPAGKAYWKVDFKAQNFPEAIRFPTNPYY